MRVSSSSCDWTERELVRTGLERIIFTDQQVPLTKTHQTRQTLRTGFTSEDLVEFLNSYGDVLHKDPNGYDCPAEVQQAIDECDPTLEWQDMDRLLVHADGSCAGRGKHLKPVRAAEEGVGDAWAFVVLGERYDRPGLVVLGWNARLVQYESDGNCFLGADSTASVQMWPRKKPCWAGLGDLPLTSLSDSPEHLSEVATQPSFGNALPRPPTCSPPHRSTMPGSEGQRRGSAWAKFFGSYLTKWPAHALFAFPLTHSPCWWFGSADIYYISLPLNGGAQSEKTPFFGEKENHQDRPRSLEPHDIFHLHDHQHLSLCINTFPRKNRRTTTTFVRFLVFLACFGGKHGIQGGPTADPAMAGYCFINFRTSQARRSGIGKSRPRKLRLRQQRWDHWHRQPTK